MVIAISITSLTKMAAKPHGCLHLDQVPSQNGDKATRLPFDCDKLRTMIEEPTPIRKQVPMGSTHLTD